MAGRCLRVALVLHSLALASCCGPPPPLDSAPPAPAPATASPAECTEPHIKVGDKCYAFLLDFARTWSESREYCQGIGGDLAIVHTCDEFTTLVRNIHMLGQEVPDRFSYWLGGTDLGDEGSWTWIDGTPMAMGVPFWGQAGDTFEPNGGDAQNCAQIYKDDRYFIHDGECGKHGYALCQEGLSARLDNRGRIINHRD
ncbi:perlucin-like protein [Penaeus japonicus]|uniref:perlucin-like protein n=1 Tax=Penaeus japonicus TaxID=27405 RepID=UPI001C7153F5|nr:perlucin-like protein [Penaeus japonicus]